MSIITNNKITEGQRDAVWVQHQQDRLTGTPQENKAVFDEYAELIRGKFNSALDSIDSALGDASTATSEIEGRVEALEEINVSDVANSARASAESASASATQAQTALAEATSYAVKHFKQVWTTTSSTFEEFTFEPSGYVYTASDYYEVFVNGFKLNEDEYEQDGATITLAEPITEADNIVEVCVSKFVSPMTYVEQAQEYAEEAQGYASDAESYATTALGYSEQADASATNALNAEERINETAAETRTYKESAQASAESASASADEAESFAVSAQNSATSASTSATSAQASAAHAEDVADDIQNVTATATTLSPGSQATASFNTGTDVLTLGIPQGAKGDKGDKGEKGDKGDKGDAGEITYSQWLYCFPNGTATGSIASFSDGADNLPMKSLKVQITPKQSGSGDPSPSNVRPISGWTDAGINISPYEQTEKHTITGKNLYNAPNDKTGVLVPCHIDGGVQVVISETSESASGFRYYDANKQQIDYWTLSSTASDGRKYRAFTTMRACEYVEFYGAIGTNFMVETGVTVPSPYEPYGTHTPVPLGQTVYGGTVDVDTGVLTITESEIVHLKNLNWLPNSQGPQKIEIYTQSTNGIKANGVSNAISNMFKNRTVLVEEAEYSIRGYAESGTIAVGMPTSVVGDDSGAVAWLNEHDPIMVYEVKNPNTVQLTPTQVATLLGTNNVWSDAGDCTVTYRKDPTLALEELQAQMEALVLENNN